MLLTVVLVAAGFALTLVVLYPGYMTNDATFVYGFMKECASATGSRLYRA